MLAYTIYLSFAGALALAVWPRGWAGAARVFALLIAICGLGIACAEYGTAGSQGIVTVVDTPWIPAMGVHFTLAADGISRVLVLLTGLAAVAGILFSWNVGTREGDRANEFFAFFLALIGGVYGVFLSADLFLLFVFYEIAIVPKYFLIAIWGSTRREYAAMKLALYSFAGSAMVLIGLLAAYATAGSHTMNLQTLAHYPFPVSFQMWAFPLVFTGFAILAGMWPFHTWAPTGHVAAPTAASMLLAGVVMKLGAYGCLRVAMTLFPHGLDPWGFSFLGIDSWRTVFALFAVIGIVYGAAVALVQNDFKFVIGYSSVSHMGLVLLGLLTLTQIGIDGAVLQMFSHGVLAGLLFATVGRIVYERTHTRDLGLLSKLQLAKAMPFAACLFVLAGMASMGLPGFSGFVAEVQVLIGAWHAFPWFAVVAGVGIVVGVAYTWRAMQRAFFSDLPALDAQGVAVPVPEYESVTVAEIAGVVLLLVASLAIGLYPRLLLDVITPAVNALPHALLTGGPTVNSVNYAELFTITLPETILEVVSLLVLLVDLGILRRSAQSARMAAAGVLGVLGCMGAVVWLATHLQSAQAFGDALVATPLAAVAQIGILLLTALVLLLSIKAQFSRNPGEFVAIVLLATTGMMLVAAARDLLVIFVALELLSLSLYVLTAFAKSSAQSAEAALKYYLFGGMSAALMLFGFSYLYGLTGTTSLVGIAAALSAQAVSPLWIVALVLVAAGLGFKVAAVPFHLWAPDTYQGAPAPVTALIASGSKVASFALLIAVSSALIPSSHAVQGTSWIVLVVWMAAGSIVLGNLAALVQTSVRRLLAYSAIAHAGYMLLGIAAQTPQSGAAVLYYALTYALTTVGAFGVIAIVERATGSDRLDAFAGLSRRNPLLAGTMLLFLLSLAGIPPLVGFWAKFNLFAAVLRAAAIGAWGLGLVILALAASAVSLYYYLQVLKRIYVFKPTQTEPLPVSFLELATLLLIALAVVGLGILPGMVSAWIPFGS